jgi:hypothetical protein
MVWGESMRKVDCRKVSKPSLELFETFHALEPSRCWEQTVDWPQKLGRIARASGIGYRSKKWDLIQKNFIHEHKQPLPQVLIKNRAGFTFSSKKQFKRPPKDYVVLGKCLDIELAPHSFNSKKLQVVPDSEGYAKIDFTTLGQAKMPWLCADAKRNLLIVVPVKPNESIIILWSPIIKIDKRGILY